MTWTAKYFTYEEMTFSETAVRHGIDNDPSPAILTHLEATALRMDGVRAYLGKPVNVSSGFRGEQVNKLVGGSSTSAHSLGYAVDFKCPSFGIPLKVAEAIRDSGIKFDQLIAEGTWVHISFDPRMRQQCLTARFHPGRATTYEVGLHA